MHELEIQNSEYKIGTIWEYLNEKEKEYIQTIYDLLIKFKDDKDFVTFLYSCGAQNHPLKKDSGYYTEKDFLELKKYVDESNEERYEAHQQNKLVHDKIYEYCEKYNISRDIFEKMYIFLDSLCAKIINDLYKKNIKPSNFTQRAQLTWYTEGDFIKMHNDGPINDRLCGVLIYLTPKEYYNVGNGGELILQNRKNTVDIVYPILGNYAVIDFTKNTPFHAVHKVIGDFNRFAYLHFVILNENK